MDEPALLRIGELSRRSGVSPELLRAWERRYRLLRPQRSPGGLRLYTRADLDRVREMQRHLADGIAAAEAAALASGDGHAAVVAPQPVSALADDLAAALAAFDEPRAQAVLDTLLATTTLDAALIEVVFPYLHDLGERWERGEVSVAQEHFATSVVRGRLLALTRGWGRGLGPRVVLACAPREQHDLALIAFGLALRARGWRIVYLGADTPIESVAEAARSAAPTFVVVATVEAARLRAVADDLRALAVDQRLCLAGAGTIGVDDEFDVPLLAGDPVQEADRLTELARKRG